MLIINSDDYGLDSSIDEAILKAAEAGVINSTSVLINCINNDDIIDCLKRSNLNVGLHANLTTGTSLHKSHEKKTLTNYSNNFFKLPIFLLKYFSFLVKHQEIYDEFESQILKLKSKGIKISHIDSHQHIHLLPGIWRIINLLALKHQIPRVRVSLERVRLKDPLILILKKIIFTILSIFNKEYDKIHYFKFYGLSMQNQKNYSANLKKILNEYEINTVDTEIMVHLSIDDDIMHNEKIKHGRQRELDVFLDPKIKKLLNKIRFNERF